MCVFDFLGFHWFVCFLKRKKARRLEEVQSIWEKLEWKKSMTRIYRMREKSFNKNQSIKEGIKLTLFF